MDPNRTVTVLNTWNIAMASSQSILKLVLSAIEGVCFPRTVEQNGEMVSLART